MVHPGFNLNEMKNLLIISILMISAMACRQQETPVTPQPPRSWFLLSAADAADHLGAEGWVFIDVRQQEDYQQGHIPGAIRIYRDDFEDTTYPYQGMMPSPEFMSNLLGQAGIRSTDTLVLYDQYGDVNASRLWWILYQYGHSAIHLLHGGFTTWQQEERPLDTGLVQQPAVQYVFGPALSKDIRATKEDIVKAIIDTNYLIIDTRSLEEYTGAVQKSGATRPGHIPGSIHADYIYTLQYDGNYQFRDTETLRHFFLDKGITPDKHIITYCHSGVRSALTLFVLSEILQYPDVQNYDGSWVEWSYFPELPIETDTTITPTQL